MKTIASQDQLTDLQRAVLARAGAVNFALTAATVVAAGFVLARVFG
jgi:hypothetical protein